MSARHLLITGATGGLGLEIVRQAIVQGHRVRATGRSLEAGEKIKALGAEFIPVDLSTDQEIPTSLTISCDTIIHAAALSASWGTYSEFARANIHMTRKLLNAAKKAGIHRFVFISSPSIFADFKDRLGITELDPPADPPLNHYAHTKLQAERDVLSAATPSFYCCAIRPRALVGPGDKVILPRLINLAMRKRIPLPGFGRALIELTDLRDAAHAILSAERNLETISGQAINISGEKPVSVRMVAERLSESVGRNPMFIDIPLLVARGLASLMEAMAHLLGSKSEPLLTRYTLATLGYSQTFDLTAAKELLGYQPRYNALETLLEEAKKLNLNGASI